MNTGQRIKGQKREEHYKSMWNELETLLKNNLHTPDHRNVYTCLLECHKFNLDDEKVADKVELDEALRELENNVKDPPRASVIRATTDSPMSPPPLSNFTPRPSANSAGAFSTPKTLYDVFASQTKGKTRPDFNGRITGVKLYANCKSADNNPREGGMEVE